MHKSLIVSYINTVIIYDRYYSHARFTYVFTRLFRVKTLTGNHESCIVVSDIDDSLLGIDKDSCSVVTGVTGDENVPLPSGRCDSRPVSGRLDVSIHSIHNYTNGRSDRSDAKSDVKSGNEDRIEELRIAHNNEREKTIFLRAALQLLDESSDTSKNKNKTTGDNHDKTKSSLTSDFFRTKYNKQIIKTNRVVREDNIRFGWLKKASKGGAFSSVSSLWKAKFVELRHGVFSYEDDFYGQKKAQKKNISLSMETCYCQVIKMREKSGDFVFELSMRGGRRRLWQAASVRDRDTWINAINSAMTRGPDRYLEPSTCENQPLSNIRMLLEPNPINYNNGGNHGTHGNGNNNNSNNNNNGYNSSNNINSCQSITSSDGAAAPYTDEISRYCSIMLVIKAVDSVEHYRDIIQQLQSIRLNITVPVFFVKVNCT